jgi:hypothetical protein
MSSTEKPRPPEGLRGRPGASLDRRLLRQGLFNGTFELIEGERPAQTDAAVELGQIPLVRIENPDDAHLRLNGAKPLDEGWPLIGELDVVYEHVDPDSLPELERFQRIRRHEHAVTASAECLVDQLLGSGFSLDDDDGGGACASRNLTLPQNLAIAPDPDESSDRTGITRRLRPERRRREQAEALRRRDRLEPSVHVQLREDAPQVVADRLGRDREVLRHLGRR